MITSKEILDKLKYFTQEEANLIKMRFGIGFPKPMTIEQIADKVKKKDIELLKIQLIGIEKRIIEMLK